MSAEIVDIIAARNRRDDSLIEAEAEIARLYASMPAGGDCHAEPQASLYRKIYALEDFIVATPPATLAGAAVKLRRLLDAEVGMDGGSTSDRDVPSLVQVLALLHTIVGQPTHPTRPTASLANDAA